MNDRRRRGASRHDSGGGAECIGEWRDGIVGNGEKDERDVPHRRRLPLAAKEKGLAPAPGERERKSSS